MKTRFGGSTRCQDVRSDLGQALDEIERQGQQAIADPLRPSLRHDLGVDALRAGWQRIETNGYWGTFLGDELMQRPQRTGSAGLDLQRHDPAAEFDDVVHFGVIGTAPPKPVGQLSVGPAREKVPKMLTNELLGRRAGIDQLGAGPAGEGSPTNAANGVHQADVEKDEFEYAFLQIGL